MTYVEMADGLEREKRLVQALIHHLEGELNHTVSGDVAALEESMPEKQKILESIAKNRGNMQGGDEQPDSELASRIRKLQQDLVGLWKKARGLNELSQGLVSKRLVEIERQLDIFFAGPELAYDRAGNKAKKRSHTFNLGV
ncbi:MAG: flagellar export chaperone FlgN [Deltaproteobacteria bacterium]|nr:flagellar export chaperone FlgN [Deltaproteobacteria bacterium]